MQCQSAPSGFSRANHEVPSLLSYNQWAISISIREQSITLIHAIRPRIPPGIDKKLTVISQQHKLAAGKSGMFTILQNNLFWPKPTKSFSFQIPKTIIPENRSARPRMHRRVHNSITSALKPPKVVLQQLREHGLNCEKSDFRTRISR